MATEEEKMTRLRDASYRALGGPNPYDPWLTWDLTLEAAAVFVAAWVDEIIEKARELGQDTSSREFAYRIAIGALAVGAEYGITRQREQPATNGGGG